MIAKVIVDISTSEIDNVFDYEIPSSLAVGVEIGRASCRERVSTTV